MRKRLPILFAGLGVAALTALVGRGGLFHSTGVISLVGLCLVVASFVWLVDFFHRRRYGPTAATVATVGLIQLLSLPLGAAINRWDIARARAWCERTAPEVVGFSEAEVRAWLNENGYGQGPVLGDYLINTCIVTDRTSFMRYWTYHPETGTWGEAD